MIRVQTPSTWEVESAIPRVLRLLGVMRRNLAWPELPFLNGLMGRSSGSMIHIQLTGKLTTQEAQAVQEGLEQAYSGRGVRQLQKLADVPFN